MNVSSFSRVLMTFAVVSALGIVLQVDAAGVGPDQKADALPSDPATFATIKTAIALARKGELAQSSDVKESMSDPVARKVVEWAILRSKEVDFQRYVAFISDNPSWPNIGLLRRRAEAALWKERLDPQIVRGYFGKDQPLTAQGKFALARALLLEGDRADAQNLVREAWRYDNFSGDLEAQILDVFRDLITDADHKARMDMRLYAEDVDGAMRSANRAGGNAPVIAKARVAVIKKAADAKAQLDGVPAEARSDIGYIFSRAQWLRREEKATEAAELMLSVPNDPTQALDADQWWIERRFVSRTLLDLGDAKTAYRVASAAAVPSRENYRAEQQFTSGWIALQFLDDASTALAHFAKVGQGTSNPIALARVLLLARPRGRGARQAQRRSRALRVGGSLLDRLLRPARTGAARAQGHCDTAAARPRPGPNGCRARDRDPVRHWRARPHCRAASPTLANGPWTRRRSQRSAKSPPVTKTRAPWCCSVGRRSGADFRWSNSHSLPSESRTIARSGLGLSRGSSMPSPVRKVASIRALFRARVP